MFDLKRNKNVSYNSDTWCDFILGISLPSSSRYVQYFILIIKIKGVHRILQAQYKKLQKIYASTALKDHNHLVGGRDPKAGEVKYIVGIRTYQFTCGGGIIGEKFILTAAHCVKVDPDTMKFLPPFRILAGTNVLRGHNPAETIVIDVEEAYLPSVYISGGLDDIAVLKVNPSLFQ